MNTSKWLGVGIVVVVLIAVAYFVGQSSNNPTQTPSPLVNTAVQQSTSTQSENNTATGTQGGVATPADWANTPIINNADGEWQKISLGSEAITKEGITFSQSIVNLGTAISASDNLWGPYASNYGGGTGNFVQVNLTMNNTTQASAVVEVVTYFLADQAGRGYHLLMSNSSCGSGGVLETPQSLDPGIPCTAHILFEASQESQTFNLDFDMRNDQYNGNQAYGK